MYTSHDQQQQFKRSQEGSQVGQEGSSNSQFDSSFSAKAENPVEDSDEDLGLSLLYEEKICTSESEDEDEDKEDLQELEEDVYSSESEDKEDENNSQELFTTETWLHYLKRKASGGTNRLTDNNILRLAVLCQRSSSVLFLCFALMIFDQVFPEAWSSSTQDQEKGWITNMAGFYGSLLFGIAAMSLLFAKKGYKTAEETVATVEQLLFAFTIIQDIGSWINEDATPAQKIIETTSAVAVTALITAGKDKINLGGDIARIGARASAAAMPGQIADNMAENPGNLHWVTTFTIGTLAAAVAAAIAEKIGEYQCHDRGITIKNISSFIFDVLVNPVNLGLLSYMYFMDGYAITGKTQTVDLSYKVLVGSLSSLYLCYNGLQAYKEWKHVEPESGERQPLLIQIQQTDEPATDDNRGCLPRVSQWLSQMGQFRQRNPRADIETARPGPEGEKGDIFSP